MNTSLFFSLYSIGLVVFIVCDLVWLSIIAKSFYHNRIGHLLGEVNWLAVTIFYLVFLLGLTYFAIYPSVTKGTFLTGIILGALFGFFTYATYDLTNMATLRNWPWTLTVVDIVWGTLLGAFVTVATIYIHNFFA